MADIRSIPAADGRVETGPLRFGDDWPGVFIRGDEARRFVAAVEHSVVPSLRGDGSIVSALIRLLKSSQVTLNG